MKKILWIIFIICICMLCSCSSKSSLSGKITESTVNDDVGLTSFVVNTHDDKQVGILLTDETSIISNVDGISPENFKSGIQTDVSVSVDYSTSPRTLVTNSGDKITAYNAIKIYLTGYLTDTASTLSDGTSVNVWQYSSSYAYTLENDTELLTVQLPTGPDNVYVGGVESLSDLTENAQGKILEYYENQGILYDEPAVLEKAYEDYMSLSDKSQFDSYNLGQDISPCASSDTVIYFITTVQLPIDGSRGYENRIGAAFDKATGEHIDNWDLFSCSPEEAVQKLLDISDISNEALKAEMMDAFEVENIILFPENLEVCFNRGTLPSEEYPYLVGFDYDDALLQILNPWAVPTKE